MFWWGAVVGALMLWLAQEIKDHVHVNRQYRRPQIGRHRWRG